VIYNHEKSFGNILVFDWEDVEIVLLKRYVRFGPPPFGCVGAIFRSHEVTQLQHDSFLFREAAQVWHTEEKL